MSPPPKTRKCDSEEPGNSDDSILDSTPTRSDSLYFNDGNIVLIAENTAFRVHKGLLTLHSGVFRDMFGDVEQPEDAEMFDGCSVVRLFDDGDVLEAFLKALYMIVPIRYTEDPKESFRLQYVLLSATKYSCNTMRKLALEEFAWKYFPDTLAKWDARDSSLAPEPNIVLARCIKAEILLPAAFYLLCRDGPETGDLYMKDVVPLWKGGRVIGAFWPNFVKDQMIRHKGPPCDHPHCKNAWKAFWRKKTMEALENSQSGGMDPLLQLKKCPDDLDGAKDVCWEAKRTIRKSCDAKREEIWNKLPEIFELGSWAKLRAAADGSCDGHVKSLDSSAFFSYDGE